MTLRWKILATFVLILGVIVVVLSAAYHQEMDRFLLDHTLRTLRVQAQPALDAYASRLAATGLPLGLLARELARDLTTPAATAVVLDAAGRVVASGNVLPEHPAPLPPDLGLATRAAQSGRAVSVVQPADDGRQMTLYIPLVVTVPAPWRSCWPTICPRPWNDWQPPVGRLPPASGGGVRSYPTVATRWGDWRPPSTRWSSAWRQRLPCIIASPPTPLTSSGRR